MNRSKRPGDNQIIDYDPDDIVALKMYKTPSVVREYDPKN